MHIDHHPPGTFCWIELATTDQAAAKAFYGAVFDWTVNEFPMGPDGTYTIFQLEGRDAAAGYTLRPDQTAHGVPPHWLLYISVENADASVARATELGGKVMAGPFDVMDFGRMAVIQDPAGATFAVWQPKAHIGTTIGGIPGTICWADLSAPEPGAAVAFYRELFGWKIEAGEGEDPATAYLHISNGEEMIGGVQASSQRNPSAPPHWLTYFLVADCDASAAKAQAGGAMLYLPPMTMEKVGRFSVIADPQGAAFAIFQPPA